MGGRSASEIICLSVNHSITLVGKVWLLVMLLLRILVLLLAGYPLYQDEQERFICNTIQPGCANVCYDLFSPVSLFRFWLVQLLVLCLPYLVFIIYVVHKVSSSLRAEPDADLQSKNAPLKNLQQQGERRWATTQHFTGAYMVHLLLRMVLEAGFGATHYYLFGFYIPSRFLCQQPPCTTQVDCYISRPTEKTVMLCFMLGAGALCLLLNVLDLVCAAKRSVRQRSRRRLLVHKVFEEERYYTTSQGAAGDATAVSQDPEGEVSHSGSFRKQKGLMGKESTGGGPEERSSLPGTPSSPPPPGAPGSNTNNGNNGYPQEDVVHHGSEVALFSPDPLGTPRAIRVSKRGRLKPPPPPRRGGDTAAGVGSLGRGRGSIGDVSAAVAAAAVCTRKVGQYTLVELSSAAELQASDDGADKRSEWV